MSAVQLLTEEFATMSPGELEAKGLSNLIPDRSKQAVDTSDTQAKIAGEFLMVIIIYRYCSFDGVRVGRERWRGKKGREGGGIAGNSIQCKPVITRSLGSIDQTRNIYRFTIFDQLTLVNILSVLLFLNN